VLVMAASIPLQRQDVAPERRAIHHHSLASILIVSGAASQNTPIFCRKTAEQIS
jgi:hypothetical protein